MNIQVGAGVLNQTPLDWDGNRDHILSAIAGARRQAISVLCLPELSITGYGCEDAFHSVGTQRTSLEVLREIVPHTRDMIVSVGLPLFHRGGVYNTACLIADGRIEGFVAKQNLAGEGLHYEPRWFKPWPINVAVDVELEGDWAGTTFPLGDLVFDCGGVQLGFEICEDAWVANRPGGQLAAEGADLLLNPSASHFAFGKHDVRRRFVLDGSRAFCVAYVYANLLGNEAGRAIYDGDAMVACCGKLLANGPRFSFRNYHVTSACVDIDKVRVARGRAHSFRTRMDDKRRHVDVRFQFPSSIPTTSNSKSPPIGANAIQSSASWEDSRYRKEEEFARAVSLGLFDYMRKSKSNGFVVSLSGGADSSAVATLCGLMVLFAMRELGVERLAEKLSYLDLGSTSEMDSASLIEKLLRVAW